MIFFINLTLSDLYRFKIELYCVSECLVYYEYSRILCTVDKLGYIFIVAFDDQYSIGKQKSSSSKFDISKNINSHGYKSPPVKLF